MKSHNKQNTISTVYIDGLVLLDSHFSGVGQYVLGILRAMDELVGTKKIDINIKVIIPLDKLSSFNKFDLKNIKAVTFPLPFRLMIKLWRRRLLPPMDIFFRHGVFLFPHFVNMRLLNSKSLLCIYDLSYILFPQYSDEANARWLTKQVAISVNEVNKIITISHNAKREIADFYNIDPSDIIVATPAVDQSIFYRRSGKDIELAKQTYSLPENYIVSLSNLEPRKNLEMLVDAYCKLPKELSNKTSLLLIGAKGWKTDSLLNKIDGKIKDGYRIRTPSHYVKDEDRAAILSGATLLAYPSHYEGFGMPPLEALACGTPVLVGDNSSLPEAVGDAGILVNSDDLLALTSCLQYMIDERKSLTAKSIAEGPKHAGKFTWEESAMKILKAANQLMEIEK